MPFVVGRRERCGWGVYKVRTEWEVAMVSADCVISGVSQSGPFNNSNKIKCVSEQFYCT